MFYHTQDTCTGCLDQIPFDELRLFFVQKNLFVAYIGRDKEGAPQRHGQLFVDELDDPYESDANVDLKTEKIKEFLESLFLLTN